MGKRENPVLREMRKMEIGQVLLVERKDWKIKSTLSMVISSKLREWGKKFVSRALENNKWWVVMRTK